MLTVDNSWPLYKIVDRLKQLKNLGFVQVPKHFYRKDDGIVGHILEYYFGIPENNLSISDLGRFELKALRAKSSAITLCHKNPAFGMKPMEVFEKFSYVNFNERNPDELYRKLFTTIRGNKKNNRGFQLQSKNNTQFILNHNDQFLAEWDISDSLIKMNSMILVIADSLGTTDSNLERFHYKEAFLCQSLKPIPELVKSGALSLDFCIDQKVGSENAPHDRGPHIRLLRSKLTESYEIFKPIL
jgi:hypothetical protein